MLHCDECDKSVHDRTEYKFYFSGIYKKDTYHHRTLCLECFDLLFGIARFALFASNNPYGDWWCSLCERKLNLNKENFNSVRGCNHNINIEVFYCRDCYRKDIGHTEEEQMP